MPDLPVQLTSFVGRDIERTHVEKALTERRLVTLAGPGGIGKTRLAVAVAEASAHRYVDGACWVDLGSLVDPEQVTRTVTAATQVLVHPAGDPRRALVAQLKNRQQLVCLDTCEHLLVACAELVDLLLRGCPGVSVLATSREPLGVSGEAVWRVPPMGMESASRLFADRAALVVQDYVAGKSVEQEICERLDGVPLAIELAAAWAGVLAPGEIAARLRHRSTLLPGGPRLAPERHRSLTASLAWSYDLLDETDRELFRGMAVFAGGFDLDAASAVCTGGAEVLDGVRRLVDKSLLAKVNTPTGARFHMLETIREYASDRLEQAAESTELRRRHLEYYLGFARVAEAGFERDQDYWRIALHADHDNLRAALIRALDEYPGHGRELAAALSRFWFVCGHTNEGMGYLRRAIDLAPDDRTPLQAALLSGAAAMAVGNADGAEAAELAERGIDIAGVGDRHRGRCLTWAAHRWLYFDSDASHDLASEGGRSGVLADDPFTVEHAAILRARTLANRDRHAQTRTEIGDARRQALARGDRCTAAFAVGIEIWADLFTGEVPSAVSASREALTLVEPLGDHFAVGHITVNLAWALALSGDFDGARAAIEPVLRSVSDTVPELLRCFAVIPGLVDLWQGRLDAAHHWLTIASRFAEPATDNWHVAQVLPPLAETLRRLGRPGEARVVAERAVALATTLDVPHVQAEALDELGYLARDKGSGGEAARLHHRALDIRVEHGLRTFWPDSFDALAGVTRDPAVAVRLLAASESGRVAVGRGFRPVDDAGHTATVTTLRAKIDPDTFAETWSAGIELTLDEAADYASRQRRGRSSGTGWQSLTLTERQVVDLVVAGQTNPEIGARLFMSRSTVKTHLAHVFAKVAVANRAELAAAAGRRHAVDVDAEAAKSGFPHR
ncbi:helix-turn-helix transcriptional regulator [Amycolatopsis sp. cmx-11-51]|uniref:helix-turn-helix transcriptional regulator n=1 Tax=Amycolatopsis sp. cmx-11-51 TaxID=2785797 RepID=UPI0039E6ACA5